MAFAGLGVGGWPIQNFATTLRSLKTPSGASVRQAMALPRLKFTFLIEMNLNISIVQNPVFSNIINNGRIYGQLKSISYPKPRFAIETLRSYNRYRKIYKKLEYDPATIVWTDDSTSMIQTLVKEYIKFYHETGDIGSENPTNDNLQINTEFGIVGNNVRNGMGTTQSVGTIPTTRPSLGLKLRKQTLRHFFESITIYDLGTEPTCVNIHTFNTPVIVSFDHDNLDWYSNDIVNTTWSFEYENYFFAAGINVDQFDAVFQSILGAQPGQYR